MPSYHALTAGCRYRVVREFRDYDGCLHPVGETWDYLGSNFLPYDDGLTLHVRVNGLPLTYRLQWRPEEQAAIIEHFTDYVASC